MPFIKDAKRLRHLKNAKYLGISYDPRHASAIIPDVVNEDTTDNESHGFQVPFYDAWPVENLYLEDDDAAPQQLAALLPNTATVDCLNFNCDTVVSQPMVIESASSPPRTLSLAVKPMYWLSPERLQRNRFRAFYAKRTNAVANDKRYNAAFAKKMLAEQQTEHCFRALHYLATNNLPSSQFELLSKTMMRCGVDMGTNLHSRYTANEMLKFLAGRQRKRLIQVLQNDNTTAVAPLLDEATHRVFDKQLCLLFRFEQNGQPVTVFYRLILLQNDFSAQAMYNAITAQLNDDGLGGNILRTKLVGLGADGAAVISGHVGGLGILLKADFPNLLRIHCGAHRVGLVGKDIIKKKTREDTIAQHVKTAGHVFNTVALVKNKLNEVAAGSGIARWNSYLTVRKNRWVNHFSGALKGFVDNIRLTIRFCRRHDGLHTHLPTLKKFILQLPNIFHCAALLDVIVVLGKLNTRVQRSTITMRELITDVAKSKADLQATASATVPTEHLLRTVNRYNSEMCMYDGELVLRANDTEWDGAICASDALIFRTRMALKALERLNARFPDDDVMQNIIKFRDAPDLHTIVKLGVQFGLNPGETSEADFLAQLSLERSGLSLAAKVSKQIWTILLVLPPTSVACESLFRTMSRVLTSDRNRLGQANLEHCLTLSVGGISAEMLDRQMPLIVHEWKEAGHHLPSKCSLRNVFDPISPKLPKTIKRTKYHGDFLYENDKQ